MAKYFFHFFIGAMVIVLIGACESKALSPKQYLHWIATHKDQLTVSSSKDGEILHSITYIPAGWLAIKEAGEKQPRQIADALMEYNGLEYYRLRLALRSGQGDILQYAAANTDEYYARVSYFSFDMQNDVSMLIGKDTFPCRLFHFERNYGAAPYLDFMLGFDPPETGNVDRTLIYYDPVYSNTPVTMIMAGENITRIPKLKL